jgi:hypothetical protein
MYEFVGALMGMALRTGETFNIDLGPSTWKQLLGEKLTIHDIESIDKLCVSALTHLSTMSKPQFESMMLEKWTTVLSNGKEAEVKAGGRNQNVTFESRNEFIECSIQTRLHEADAQIRAIKKGLNAVVPANMLSLFSWNDLELLVCGNPEIDLAMLRKHTVYQVWLGWLQLQLQRTCLLCPTLPAGDNSSDAFALVCVCVCVCGRAAPPIRR